LGILFHIAASSGWMIEAMDVTAAFLCSDLSEEIYVQLPEGCKYDKYNTARLNIAIYGLKQSSKAWHNELKSHLISTNWTQCEDDSCLFKKKSGNDTMYI
jgi:hypothetical protein